MEETQKDHFRIKNLASTVVLCAMVLLCMVVAIQVLMHGYASLGGYSLFRVVTGSMEPTIPVNALVVSRKTDIGDIAVGDIIVFRSRVTLTDEKIITHRVVAVEKNGGTVALETRGDANPVADSRLVDQSDLIGRVVWFTHREGGAVNVIGFLSGKFGFLACIVFPILLLGGLILRGSIDSIRKQLDQVVQDISSQENGLPPQADPAASAVVEAPQEQDSGLLLSAEEYEEIYNKVKAELLEELKQDGEGNRE